MENQNKKTPESTKKVISRALAACGCFSILFGFAANANAQNVNLINFADQAKELEEYEVTTISTTQTTEKTTETVTKIVELNSVSFKALSSSTETVLTEPTNNEEAENLLSQITVDSTTEKRIIAAMNYFVSQGFTPEAAAGILGNIAVESGYNPALVSSTGYYGLCQWNTSSAGGYWWNSVQDWIISNGFEWNSFEGQIRAIIECPRRGQLSDSRLEELKGLTSVDQASELIAVYYEACVGGSTLTQYYRVGYCYQNLSLRSSEAWIAYNIYNDSSLKYTGQKPYIH